MKASFVIFELPPFFENIGKRVIKSPKVYFTDPGLAAHILGIETAAQAARDPIRGGLYENLVILEFLKNRLNLGLRPELYFYRDTHGNEVDLIVKKRRRLIPIEIKSAATFTPQFLQGIERFRDALAGSSENGWVLYGGDRKMTVKGIRVLNPFTDGIGEILEEGG